MSCSGCPGNHYIQTRPGFGFCLDRQTFVCASDSCDLVDDEEDEEEAA